MFEPLCFMKTSGMYVSTALRGFFYDTALDMVRTSERERYFKTPDHGGEGVVTTKYRTSQLGDFGGIQFDVVLDIGKRRFNISFVVSSRRLKEGERGVWIDLNTGCVEEDEAPVDPRALN
jgi:hypothetical protein